MRHPNITSTLAGLIVVTSVCYSAGLAERGFKDLLASIQARLGVAGSEAPVQWLADALFEVNMSNSTHDFNLAVFENLPDRAGTEKDFEEAVRSGLGEGWKPLVRVRSRRNQQSTGIYVKESGGKMNVILAMLNSGKATIIQARFEPEHLAALLRDNPEQIVEALSER